MAKKQNKLKDQVLAILAESVKARNDDAFLVASYWVKHNASKLRDHETERTADKTLEDGTVVQGKPRKYIFLSDLDKVESADNIVRVRRHVQNVDLKYPPTIDEVIRKRGKGRTEWLAWAREARSKTQ